MADSARASHYLSHTSADHRARSSSSQSLAGFAGPMHPLSQLFCERVTQEYAKSYLRLFLERHAAGIAEVSEGLVPLLEHGLDVRLPFETIWDVSFADVRSAALARETSSRDVVHIGAMAGLRLICHAGLRGAFVTALDGRKSDSRRSLVRSLSHAPSSRGLW